MGTESDIPLQRQLRLPSEEVQEEDKKGPFYGVGNGYLSFTLVLVLYELKRARYFYLMDEFPLIVIFPSAHNTRMKILETIFASLL